jgi:chromosome partitioning protein
MNGKVITIAHQKGGVGKSTIAINLAVELSKRFKLKVVDLDFQKSITIFNETRKEKGLNPLDIIHIDTRESLIGFLKNNDDIVLIDSGGFDSDLNRISILGADLIITPVSSDLIEIYGLEAFKRILKDLKSIEPDIKSYILLNKIDPKATKSIKELEDYINRNKDYFNLLNVVLRRRKDFSKSFEEGKSVIEIDENSKASDELKELIDNIETILLKY